MNPVAGDVFQASLATSALGALWGWGLSLLLGAMLLPQRGFKDAGGKLLSWLVLGTALQTQLWLLLGMLGRLTPTLVLATAGALTALSSVVAGRRVLRALPRLAPSARNWLFSASALTTTAFLLVVGLLATWPTVFYDDLVYHLGLPRQALLTGHWPALPGLHYSFMPAGWDAVYVLPLALGGGNGPQLMNALGLGLFAWAVYRLARRGAEPGSAAAATALLVLAPMFTSLGAFAGNDLFVGLALCVAMDRLLADLGRSPASVGALLGAAWGAKYSALPGCAGIAAAVALVRRGSWPARLGAAGLAGLVTILLPLAWTVRSYVLTGSPLYPAFFGMLGGEYWSTESAGIVNEQVSHGGLANRGPASLILALADLLLRSDTLGFPSGINPAFLILGLAGILLYRRVSGAGPLLTVAGITYFGWCVTSLNLRYALIMLAVLTPFAAAGIEYGMSLWERRVSKVAVQGVAVGLLLLFVAGSSLGGISRHVETYGPGTRLFGEEVRADMLTHRVHLAAAGRAMANSLPSDARILLVADGRIGLLPRPALASSAYDRPDMARFLEQADSTAELHSMLAGFTHVVVNYREMDRFRRNYRFAERFRTGDWQRFQRWLREDLEPLEQIGSVVIYRIPQQEEGS